MSQLKIASYGSVEVTVLTTQSIVLSCYGGRASVIYLLTTANFPDKWLFQRFVENEEVTLGPFSTDQKIRLEVRGAPLSYNIGANPTLSSGNSTTLEGYGADDFLQTTDETKYLRTDENSTISKVSGILRAEVQAGSAIDDVFLSSKSALEVYQATSGKDAYMYFEVKDDVFGYFGLSGADNDFVVGGGSFGAVRYRLWNRGSAPEATQAEAEAGAVTAARMFTPQRISQAIAALTPGGATGSFTTSDAKTVTVTNGIITAIV
ncbi:MAG: hypothetical protein KJP07_23285 [Desulfatitalea sp.]|nr:hypothetical protein [Desulfatitalea sp.]